jgi:hypothetical protein
MIDSPFYFYSRVKKSFSYLGFDNFDYIHIGRKFHITKASRTSALGCGLNRSMQHFVRGTVQFNGGSTPIFSTLCSETSVQGGQKTPGEFKPLEKGWGWVNWDDRPPIARNHTQPVVAGVAGWRRTAPVTTASNSQNYRLARVFSVSYWLYAWSFS